MAIGTGTAILGGALISAGAGYLGSRRQASAAKSAAQGQAAAGQQASNILAGSVGASQDFLRQGASGAQGYLGQAGGLLQSEGGKLTSQFQPEIDVGQQSLARLQSALLGGDPSAIQTDPGYQFRLQEGEKALQRAAAASGGLGGGAFLKDTARFSQGLASQEYGNAVNRLLGLQQIGSQANRTQAGLAASLLGQRAGILGQQAGVAGNLGSSLASLTQQNAANQANALTGTQSAVNQYNLMGAQAQAQGLAGLGNAAQQTLLLHSLMAGGGGGQTPVRG